MATNDDKASIISLLKRNAAGITEFMHAACKMQQHISVFEMYVLCLLFEKSYPRRGFVQHLPRDRTTAYHIISRLCERKLIAEQGKLLILTPKGLELYRLFLQILLKHAENAHFRSSQDMI